MVMKRDPEKIVDGRTQEIDSAVRIGMIQFLPAVSFDLDPEVTRQGKDLYEPVFDVDGDDC